MTRAASSLRVLVTADPELPVPPTLYGGIERIIDLLITGLAGRGHDVALCAHAESRLACRLFPFPGTSSASASDGVRNAATVAVAALRFRPSVIQSFGRLAYLMPLLPLPVPKVMSYQRIVTARTVTNAHRVSRGTLSFTGCSEFLIGPVRHIGRWRAIHNAVPVDRFTFVERVDADAPLVFLGRVEKIKGPHLAIQIAKAAGRRLVIAGNVPEEHRTFFEREIQPHLDGNRVRYVGPVDDDQKNRLLGDAAALLMPLLWDEPFGIVMAEALACGTPVLAYPRGAVPEVVTDGVTGYVRSTPEALGETVAGLSRLDRAACRREAEARFSQRALVDAYEQLYQSVAVP